VLSLSDNGNATGKRLYGKENWGDYTVIAHISAEGERADAGILLRATNPAQGGAGDSPVLGTYFVQGYYVSLGQGKVSLYKLNYEASLLTETSIDDYSEGKMYELSVSAQGNELIILVDGTECIRYRDDNHPYLQGMAGVRTLNTAMQIEDFAVLPK
jgi:hypothetical protein